MGLMLREIDILVKGINFTTLTWALPWGSQKNKVNFPPYSIPSSACNYLTWDAAHGIVMYLGVGEINL